MSVCAQMNVGCGKYNNLIISASKQQPETGNDECRAKPNSASATTF